MRALIALALALLLLKLCAAAETGDVIEVEQSERMAGAAVKSATSSNSFCEGPSGLVCKKGTVLGKLTFPPVADECINYCIRMEQCVNAHYDDDKMCTLYDQTCTADELVEGTGTSYLRAPIGEECPPDMPEKEKDPKTHGARFCLMWSKTCNKPEANLYRKPQNIRPYMKCLQKCMKIATCVSVDFKNNKCNPMSYHCSDDELADDAPETMNFMRLRLDDTATCEDYGRTPFPFGPAPPPTPEPDYLCQCNMSFDTQNQCVCEPGFSMVDGTCQPACQVS